MAANWMQTALPFAGVVFGGVGLRLVEKMLSRTKDNLDIGMVARDELRADMKTLRESVASLKEEIDRVEAEVVEWREKYYELREKYIVLKGLYESALRQVAEHGGSVPEDHPLIDTPTQGQPLRIPGRVTIDSPPST